MDGRRPVEIHGHRGARGHLPENTLASFAHAFALGVQSVELDIGCTLDNELIIFHDLKLNPDLVRVVTSAGEQWIDRDDIALRSLTMPHLKQYDVGKIRPGSDYAMRFPAQQSLDRASIPSLRDVVSLVNELPGAPYLTIEIKSSPTTPELSPQPGVFASLLVQTLDALAVPLERDLITSFDWRILAAIQDLEPAMRTSFLTIDQPDDTTVNATSAGPAWTGEWDLRDYAGNVAAMVSDAGGNGWSPYFKDIDADSVDDAHSRGLFVCVWTVNEAADIDSMLDLDVDVIITDYPDRVRERMQQRGLPLPPSLTA